jgi:hypothetical protein
VKKKVLRYQEKELLLDLHCRCLKTKEVKQQLITCYFK